MNEHENQAGKQEERLREDCWKDDRWDAESWMSPILHPPKLHTGLDQIVFIQRLHDGWFEVMCHFV